MCEHVIIKVKLFSTIIGTVRTSERFVARVDPHVFSEIAFGCCLIGTI